MKKSKYILIGIIIIQIIVQILVANTKEYIHMDEGYSLGLMNYDKVEIQDNEDFYNTWHTSNYYEDYLSIQGDESYKLVYENQKNDVHPPLYYLLLRIVSSVHTDSYSKWPGIALNIFINIFCTILVYLITKKIFKSDKYALLIAAVSGVSSSTLNAILYIRMYELCAFNILLTLYLHLKIENKEAKILDYILIGITALIGSLTHYYYLFFLAVIYIMYIVNYIRKKEYKLAIKYTASMVVTGILSIAIFPYSISHMFKGNRGTGAISNLTGNAETWLNIAKYIGNLFINVFGNMGFVFVVILIGIAIYKLVKNKKLEIKNENKLMWIITIPTLVYFILIAIMSPYIELRYIMPICPLVLIIMIYFLRSSISSIVTEKKAEYIIASLLIVMVLFPLITNQKLEMSYNDKKDIVQKLENEYNLPTIFLFNKSHNRFLDDILLFSKINESYVYDLENMSEQKIQEIFEEKDISKGIIVFVNAGQDKDNNLEIVKQALNLSEITYLKGMNACSIYHIK